MLLFHSPVFYQAICGLSAVRTHQFPVRPDNISAALKMSGHGVVEAGFMIFIGTGAIYNQAKHGCLDPSDRQNTFIAFSFAGIV